MILAGRGFELEEKSCGYDDWWPNYQRNVQLSIIAILVDYQSILEK